MPEKAYAGLDVKTPDMLRIYFAIHIYKPFNPFAYEQITSLNVYGAARFD